MYDSQDVYGMPFVLLITDEYCVDRESVLAFLFLKPVFHLVLLYWSLFVFVRWNFSIVIHRL